MRVAGLLLALVLVTSCFVGGTFAKYVTGADGADNARVAKFGVTVKGTSNMFAPTYKTDDKSVTAITDSVVAVNGTDNLVAPGTKKDDCLTVSVTGKPEVAVDVQYVGLMTLTGKWQSDDNGTYYCPLIITVNGTKFNGMDYNSAKEFADAVTAAIGNLSKQYEPNTDLGTSLSKELKVSWEWPFEGGTTYPNQTDAKDTYLGDFAAKVTNEDHMPEIHLHVGVTVTQID